MRNGRVYLVGAGCGGADLITVQGLELLRRCDAVVYDDLIAPELLHAVPAGAERIYMGKRRGAHSAPQSEISGTLIRLAREGKTVVRLKGGDPFVFGRGGEEMAALLEAGIPCREIPGITSAIAIPAEAGIPVTHRGVSRGVHIVTAHTADTPDGLPEDLETLAKLHGTLVFLMGLKQLPRLTERLLAAGMAGETPAAVLSGGSAAHPAEVRGTLATIVDAAKEVKPPAVIVVGEAAALKLRDEVGQPLRGITVGLTGTDDFTGRLSRALEEQGARVVNALRMAVRGTPVPVGSFCGGGRWLVFTSGNGVRVFFRRLAEEGVDLRCLAGNQFAVIGRETAKALLEYGIHADLCPEVFTTEALGQALLERVPEGGEICLLRSARGSKALAEALKHHGRVRDVALYDVAPDLDGTRRASSGPEAPDYLVFASAGGVETWLQVHGSIPEGTTCVCIGPVTAKALQERCGAACLVAEEISAEGILKTIGNHRASIEKSN